MLNRSRLAIGICLALCALASSCAAERTSGGGYTPSPNAARDGSQTEDPDPEQRHDASTQDGSSGHPPVSEHDAAADDAAMNDAASADASPPEDSAVLDAGEPGCIDGAIRWTSNGGLVAWRRAFYVTPCRTFIAEQDNFDAVVDRLCENELPADHGITADSIDDLIAHPDVQAAIAEAPVLYGSDPRFIDGIVRQIDVAGAEILVGGECANPSGSCRAIPPGVAALAAIIDNLVEQQASEVPNCVITN